MSSALACAADVKARAAALLGMSSASLSLFHGLPVHDDEVLGASCDSYSLALNLGSSSTPGTLNLDADNSGKLPALFAEQKVCREKLNRIESALALWNTCGAPGLAVAEGVFKTRRDRDEEAAARLQPVLDANEVKAALRRAEQRAERAERRVRDLETQLADARRAQRESTPAPAAASSPAEGSTREATSPAAGSHAATPQSAISARPEKAPSILALPEATSANGGSTESCRELLIQIRKERAADVDVPAHLTSAMESLRGALHRSLRLLAEDLYRDDVHCISELLQNSDDNTFAEHVEPTWTLHYAADGAGAACCWTANNELGMSSLDVRAICDAGNSSKGGSGARIGRKGVGFKSAFRLTTCPHVLSGGFTFKFDLEANGLLGYVLPEPLTPLALESLPPIPRKLWSEQQQTVFYLPLRRSAPPPHVLRDTVRAHAPCLLFLRRLRCLCWVNEKEPERVALRRRTVVDVQPRSADCALADQTSADGASAPAHAPASDAPEGDAVACSGEHRRSLPEGVARWRLTVEELLSAETSGGGGTGAEPQHASPPSVRRFLRCAAHVHVPPYLQVEGGGAATTEIIIALPLDQMQLDSGNEGATSVGDASEGSGVYCFLPVRQIGIRFFLHAEFALTSSRGTQTATLRAPCSDWHPLVHDFCVASLLTIPSP